VAYKIPHLLQKYTPNFQLQFQFLGLIYQIAVGSVFENKIDLDRFSVMVNSVVLYHHTTINYHLYINYMQQIENYGGSSVMYIAYSMFGSI